MLPSSRYLTATIAPTTTCPSRLVDGVRTNDRSPRPPLRVMTMLVEVTDLTTPLVACRSIARRSCHPSPNDTDADVRAGEACSIAVADTIATTVQMRRTCTLHCSHREIRSE